MTDRGPVTDVDSPTALFVAALIGLAIVLLLIFARGPEDQQRSVAPTAPIVSALSTGGAIR
jgi:hypothetical protein